ncbi:MAG: membrane protein [Chloroflexi bacterium]|uniref:Membrane protein n=1 Tax=Candidatus Chlorohelix allophototropha TaxID=3003348 RepID=A0A8T7M1J6_9CHLR|nr:membrane protein [Chloroflexota bacterium]WJW66505.1 hypothetical protein OZ401_002308 [Chloroflexota bacterium L227-S17]
MKSLLNLLWRLLVLNGGLFIFAVGISCSVASNLGLPAWDVLHQGISFHIPLTLGQVIQVSGVVILLIAFWLGEKPGIGSLFNIFFIGFWIDIILKSEILATFSALGLWAQYLLVLACLLFAGIGAGLYTRPALGIGPRDSLMVALVRKTGYRVALIRTMLEILAVLAGWLLGGVVGIGTLAIAFGIGPVVELSYHLFGVKIHRPVNTSASLQDI